MSGTGVKNGATQCRVPALLSSGRKLWVLSSPLIVSPWSGGGVGRGVGFTVRFCLSLFYPLQSSFLFLIFPCLPLKAKEALCWYLVFQRKLFRMSLQGCRWERRNREFSYVAILGQKPKVPSWWSGAFPDTRLSDRSQFFSQVVILLLTWQKGRSYCLFPQVKYVAYISQKY